MAKIAVTDHKGNRFNSIKEMCNYWGIDNRTYNTRVKNYNWPMGKALETPVRKCNPIKTDHFGNKYDSTDGMCRAYGVTSATFRGRIKSGYDLENALDTTDRAKKPVKDHRGVEFGSIKEMCDFYRIKPITLRQRIEGLGWSFEEALTTPTLHKDMPKRVHGKECEDHLGNKFISVNSMCEHWGINKDVLKVRLNNGWDLQKALETKVATRKKKSVTK